MVVPLSSYSTASHAKGRFFVLLSREKISSNHDTSVLIVFIFSHNMALFLLSFFSFFCPSTTVIVVVVLGNSVVAESHKFEGTFLKIGPHMQVSTIIKSLAPFFGFPYILLRIYLFSYGLTITPQPKI